MDWVLIDLSSPVRVLYLQFQFFYFFKQHAPSVWHTKEANNKAVKILKRRHRICINNNKRAAKKQRWKQAREWNKSPNFYFYFYFIRFFYNRASETQRVSVEKRRKKNPNFYFFFNSDAPILSLATLFSGSFSLYPSQGLSLFLSSLILVY